MEAVVGAAPQVTGAREGGNGFGSQRPLIGPCEPGHIPAQLWRPLGRSNPEGRFPEVYHYLDGLVASEFGSRTGEELLLVGPGV